MESQRFLERHSRYVGIFICLLVLRTTDLWITYQLTPDLSLEWNPLVTHFKFSWQGLVLTQCALVLLAMFGFHRYTRRARNPVDIPGLTLHRFVYYYFNGREPTWRNMTASFFKIPHRRYRDASGAFIGFVVVGSFTLVSVFAVMHNLLILREVWVYLDFVAEHHRIYFPSVFIIIVSASALVFFLTEFRAYKIEMTDNRL